MLSPPPQQYSKCFVKLLGWYDTDDHLFIAMEYFPLGDLQKYMSKTGPMAEADVRPVIYQVLEGLHYMHHEGFAHRDIKPGVGAPVRVRGPFAGRLIDTRRTC